MPLLAALAALAPGCGLKPTVCRGLHKALHGLCPKEAPPPTDAAVGVVSATSGAAGPAAPGLDFALTRVAPEQLSRNLEAALDVGPELHNDANASGQSIDVLVQAYGVPLGGIDFVAANQRDPAAKAQTLLIARVIAAELGAAAVWKDLSRPAASRALFTKCDVAQDRPMVDEDAQAEPAAQAGLQASAARWEAQVSEFFWRFYARPPTGAELAAVRVAFVATVRLEGYPAAGWVVVLYALLASQEFWHV